jgi:hypothetical protein
MKHSGRKNSIGRGILKKLTNEIRATAILGLQFLRFAALLNSARVIKSVLLNAWKQSVIAGFAACAG